jgi:hypothetical protein
MNKKIKSLIVIIVGLLVWVLQSISISHDMRISSHRYANDEVDDSNLVQSRKRVQHHNGLPSERSLRARTIRHSDS